MREVLDIPRDHIVASIVALGHPDEPGDQVAASRRRGVHDDRPFDGERFSPLTRF